MIEFKVLKKSTKSRARLGILKTPHGEIETPAFVPVATQATIKTLDSQQVLRTGAQLLIANTFHLHDRPGEAVVANAGGIHKMMAWPKPLMTDSGGFQVFSLGFGRDLEVGKVLKFFDRSKSNNKQAVQLGHQAKNLKITPEGVYFHSPIDGRELFIGPKESIKIQQKIGADIIFAFDECTPPMATREYVESSLELTHKWAKLCLQHRTSKQALYGIVQGSLFKDLREKSAEYIGGLGFDGFGLGGDLGDSKKSMKQIIRWMTEKLPEDKPRHLLGIGYLEDMPMVMSEGVDTFDCIVPTHYARRGIAFTRTGKMNLGQSQYLKDKKPLDSKCKCETCQNYTRQYICHLLKAKELTGMSLLTFHNLFYFNQVAADLRLKIKKGLL